MTTETLTLTIDGAQGALLRVLGTVERRGWTVRAIETGRYVDGDGDAMVLTIEVVRLPWHPASVDVLRRHLEKLLCVTAVAVQAPPRPAAAPQAVSANPNLTMGAASCA